MDEETKISCPCCGKPITVVMKYQEPHVKIFLKEIKNEMKKLE